MRSKGPISVILNDIARRTLRQLLRITCILLFTPFIVITLASLYIYRRLVEVVLKIQFRDKFAGFLKGTDCIWAIEDVSLSVINILMILEKTARNTNAIFLQDFRKLVKHRIVSRAAGTTLEKLFHQRSQKFGYCFWKRNDEVDLGQRIRWLECEDINCDGSCEDVTSETFRRNLGNVCNKPLPDDHTAAWEILVGRRCARSNSRYLQHVEEGRSSPEERFNTDILKIPVIFRVHHSLGDGVALLGLLLEAIAEEDGAKVAKLEDRSISKIGKEFKIISPSCNSKKNFQDKAEIMRSYREDILAASMPFTYVTSRILRDIRKHFRASLKFSDSVTVESMKQQVKVSIERAWLNLKNILLKESYKRIKEAAQLITIALSAPERFIQQAVRSMDENALHGPPQAGKKIVSYWLEDEVTNDESQKLLTKIREIRRSTGTGFGDVVLAAFSVSIHKYHLRIDKPVPKALTAILPIRMAMPDAKTMTLDNNFSVALLRICISSANGRTLLEPNENSQFLERLRDIARASDELKRSPDSLLNFWFMKYLSAILPVRITRVLLSSQSTMVFSNMYGPRKVRILDSSLSNVAFWIPNKFRISSVANRSMFEESQQTQTVI